MYGKRSGWIHKGVPMIYRWVGEMEEEKWTLMLLHYISLLKLERDQEIAVHWNRNCWIWMEMDLIKIYDSWTLKNGKKEWKGLIMVKLLIKRFIERSCKLYGNWNLCQLWASSSCVMIEIFVWDRLGGLNFWYFVKVC